MKWNCLQSSKNNKQQPHRNKEKFCIIEKLILFMFQHQDYETNENIDKHDALTQKWKLNYVKFENEVMKLCLEFCSSKPKLNEEIRFGILWL
jgi:hypothetical protein